MKQFYEFILKTEVFIAKYALAILTALVFISAMARTLHYPIVWAVDVATFLFGWCVFLSGDVALRNEKLMCIDIITGRLPEKIQLYIKALNYFIIAVFLTAMIVFGTLLSFTTWYRTFQGIPGFSYTWVTISVPIGCLLMLISSIIKIKEQFTIMGKGKVEQKGKEVTELI
jgi:TRAP-type C4-dicarboxylate transport system permease small subunit